MTDQDLDTLEEELQRMLSDYTGALLDPPAYTAIAREAQNILLSAEERGLVVPDTVAIDLLDLRSPGRAFSDLVNDTSLQSTGFPMVSPRSPAESYLLHVLLRNPDGSGLAGIRGESMPPDGELAYTDLVAVARWIEGGALP